MDDPAIVGGVGAEDGVAGRGHENHVPGVNQRGGQDREGGFAPDGVADLGFRIGLHPEDFLHVLGGGGPEAWAPVVGVAAVLRLGGFQGEGGDHPGISHRVGFSHAEVEELLAWMSGERGPFGPLDALKLVDRGLLQAIARAADSAGEEVVKIGHIFVSSDGREDYDKTRPNAKGQPGMEEKGSPNRSGSDHGCTA